MKIKSQPEDFIVEEILNITPQNRGAYHLYRAVKRGLNTTDLIPRIADAFNIPRETIAYGGRKDKHALATQHLSIRSSDPLPMTLEKQNFSLEQAGYLDRPMGPDLIGGNRFTLTLRDLNEKSRKEALKELFSATASGFPNYFDDQRFGSYDNRQGFLAEKILKKHDNGAIKIYITRYGSEDNKAEHSRKEKLISAWGDWDACLKLAKKDFEKHAFTHLRENPKDFRFILRRIPRDELSGFFTAYQSYLWNEILRQFITRHVSHLKTSPGRLGPYLFYTELPENEVESLKNTVIPMPAGRIPDDPEELRVITENIFAEQGLKSSYFNLKTLRHAFFKAVPRAAVAVPEGVRHEIKTDEINSGREKIVLTFTLPRGSYATMLVKRILAVAQVSTFLSGNY